MAVENVMLNVVISVASPAQAAAPLLSITTILADMRQVISGSPILPFPTCGGTILGRETSFVFFADCL